MQPSLDEPLALQLALDPDREQEQIREERWREFCDWLKGDRPKSQSEWATVVHHLEQMLQGRRDPYYVPTGVYYAIEHFQNHEGWSGVFSAVARALKEQGL